MTDTAARRPSRFPLAQVTSVREAIDTVLGTWGVGPEHLCLASGARGSDLIFAECCLGRGARLRLLLPLPLEQFVARSVRGGPGDWEPRFLAVARRAEVLFPDEGSRPGSPFARGNDWLLDTAQAEAAPGQPFVLVVWDGHHGDSAGGTADFAVKARQRGWPVTVIDPAP
jgi:hypothetical protein